MMGGLGAGCFPCHPEGTPPLFPLLPCFLLRFPFPSAIPVSFCVAITAFPSSLVREVMGMSD